MKKPTDSAKPKKKNPPNPPIVAERSFGYAAQPVKGDRIAAKANVRLGTPGRYFELILEFPLRPIGSDEENDRAAEVCDALTDRLDKLTKDERDYLDVLTLLIQQYESKWDEAPMSPAELIRYVMEQNDLTQQDLLPQFGGAKSRVSDFLNGKRQLSKEQALALSERFCIKLEALIR